jgi:hypothetical protein
MHSTLLSDSIDLIEKIDRPVAVSKADDLPRVAAEILAVLDEVTDDNHLATSLESVCALYNYIIKDVVRKSSGAAIFYFAAPLRLSVALILEVVEEDSDHL